MTDERVFTKDPVEKWKVTHKDFYDATMGDEEAIVKVIHKFTKMVHMWANHFKNHCPEFAYEDLVQEGVEGVIHGIKSFDMNKRGKEGGPISPSTWMWWKVRASVQKAHRRHYRMFGDPMRVPVNEDKLNDIACPHSETNDVMLLSIEDILIEGCGSLSSRRALIVKDKFGLLGNKPLNPKEIAQKHGISRQMTDVHIKKFFKKIREKYPELKESLT